MTAEQLLLMAFNMRDAQIDFYADRDKQKFARMMRLQGLFDAGRNKYREEQQEC